MVRNDKDHIALNVSVSADATKASSSKGKKIPNPQSVGQQQPPQEQQQPTHEEDDDLLRRAVQDAGRWAYGTVFVEVWVLNESKTKLIRPEGGWWVDSSFEATIFESTSADHAGLDLLDPASANYAKPVPVSPGVGLAGALWSEAQQPSLLSTSLQRRGGGASADDSNPTANSDGGGHFHLQQQLSHHRHVVWRDLFALSRDPDQPFDKRVKLMVRCGLGWAAAVAFETSSSNTSSINNHQQQQQGIVVYVARQTTNRAKLQSWSNEAYLCSAADLIGSAFCLRGPRRAAVAARKSELMGALQRARSKLLALKRMGVDLETLMEKPKPQKAELFEDEDDEEGQASNWSTCCREAWKNVMSKASSLCNKCKGGNVPAPPVFTWEQTIWTFCGVFITMLMIIKTSIHVRQEYGKDYVIVLGPVGAVMTLLYGLTAAPASQPRNILMGQVLSLTIALAFSYWDSLELYVRQGLATAVAVGLMVKLGITHPPAGASAFLFCTGQYGWGNMAFLLVANIIAVGAATLINNASDKRQYPTAWGLQPLIDLFPTKQKEENDSDNNGDDKKKKEEEEEKISVKKKVVV